MVVLVGSSGMGAGMLVARVDRVCMQHGQSKQLAHLQRRGNTGGVSDVVFPSNVYASKYVKTLMVCSLRNR